MALSLFNVLSGTWEQVQAVMQNNLNLIQTAFNQQTAQNIDVVASAYNTIAQSIPNNILTSLTFDTNDGADTYSMHTSTNPSRFAVPLKGRYLVTCAAAFTANATGQRVMNVLINTSTNPYGIGCIQSTPSATFIQTVSVTGIIALNQGDFVEFQVYQNSGAPLTITSGVTANYFSPRASVLRVSS